MGAAGDVARAIVNVDGVWVSAFTDMVDDVVVAGALDVVGPPPNSLRGWKR